MKKNKRCYDDSQVKTIIDEVRRPGKVCPTARDLIDEVDKEFDGEAHIQKSKKHKTVDKIDKWVESKITKKVNSWLDGFW